MFKFTIRELLLLTVIVGLSVIWWIDHRRQTGDRRQLNQQVADLKRTDAYAWRRTATRLAEFMREEGWFVELEQDGSGYSATSPTDHPFHSLRIGDAVDECLDRCSNSSHPFMELKTYLDEARRKDTLKDREAKMVGDIVSRILYDRTQRRTAN